ncbi:MAG: GNAT family N-acetyltransferase [bacterium]|nr:GNAT family N-acetyltransferase [bacterium]
MKIRKLKIKDSKRAADIYNGSLEFLSSDVPIEEVKIKNFILDKNRIFLGIFDNEKLLGHLIIKLIGKKDASVGIVIEKKSQHKGLGGSLLKEGLKQVENKSVFAETLEYNTASQSFFEKHGFRKKEKVERKILKNGKQVSLFTFVKK